MTLRIREGESDRDKAMLGQVSQEGPRAKKRWPNIKRDELR